MQPPLKRLSTGTGQQEGQRMQDVDENFGRVEQAIDTLNADVDENFGRVEQAIDTLNADVDENFGRVEQAIDTLNADVDENFGRVEQAIDTLNAKASLHHPIPQMLSLAFGDKETRLYKNAGASADNGTVLADLREDGSATSLILSNGKLTLRKTNPDSTSTLVVIAEL